MKRRRKNTYKRKGIIAGEYMHKSERVPSGCRRHEGGSAGTGQPSLLCLHTAIFSIFYTAWCSAVARASVYGTGPGVSTGTGTGTGAGTGSTGNRYSTVSYASTVQYEK